MSKKKEKLAPLTRWQYFFKALYYNAAATTEFTYNKHIYRKSEELQTIEQQSARINYVLLLALIVMFMLTSRYQNVWAVVVYFLLVIVGQLIRYFMLPKDIQAHLTDTGRRAR